MDKETTIRTKHHCQPQPYHPCNEKDTGLTYWQTEWALLAASQCDLYAASQKPKSRHREILNHRFWDDSSDSGNLRFTTIRARKVMSPEWQSLAVIRGPYLPRHFCWDSDVKLWVTGKKLPRERVLLFSWEEWQEVCNDPGWAFRSHKPELMERVLERCGIVEGGVYPVEYTGDGLPAYESLKDMLEEETGFCF